MTSPSNDSEKLSNDLIGISGVNYIALCLTMRGLVALNTVRNTAGIDILVYDPKTGNTAAMQVKTSHNKVNFWPACKPEKCIIGDNNVWVFVRYNKTNKQWDVFLEKASKVKNQVERNLENYRKSGRKEFAYWQLPKENTEEFKILEKQWEEWKP